MSNIRDSITTNFDCREGRFVIWNKSVLVDVTDFLTGHAEVTCAMGGYVDVTIHKVRDLTNSPEANRNRVQQYLEAFFDVVAT